MALTDSDGKKKKSYGNDRASLKAKAERMLVADVAASDIKSINWAKKRLQKDSHNVQTMRDLEGGGLVLSKGEHGITDKEIKDVISGKIKKPTGIHKKKTWKEKLFGD